MLISVWLSWDSSYKATDPESKIRRGGKPAKRCSAGFRSWQPLIIPQILSISYPPPSISVPAAARLLPFLSYPSIFITNVATVLLYWAGLKDILAQCIVISLLQLDKNLDMCLEMHECTLGECTSLYLFTPWPQPDTVWLKMIPEAKN